MADFVYETYHLSLRTTRRFLRVPSNWMFVIFFPVVNLLTFSQLYKDIIQLPGFGGGSSYMAYLVPGQVVFTAFMAAASSSTGLLAEYRLGYIDKLRAQPISRWSILAGEMVPLFFQTAMMAALVLLVGLLLGATVATGVAGSLLVLALAGAFGIAYAGTSFAAALLTRSEQATSSLSLLQFPLVSISTAYVPAALLPGWMQTVNRWNPITYVIEAIRAVMVTGYDWAAIGAALLAIALLGAVLQTATLWAFHRLAR